VKKDEHRYDDMLNLPHHVSPTRPRMSVQDRAAQFAPFKAMVGLEGEITETARITDEKLEISEEEQEAINEALCEVKENIRLKPRVKILYFSPDSKKEGGAYLAFEGNVKHIDEGAHKLLFTDGTSVFLNDLYELKLL
jgi:hypothetical protein